MHSHMGQRPCGSTLQLTSHAVHAVVVTHTITTMKCTHKACPELVVVIKRIVHRNLQRTAQQRKDHARATREAQGKAQGVPKGNKGTHNKHLIL